MKIKTSHYKILTCIVRLILSAVFLSAGLPPAHVNAGSFPYRLSLQRDIPLLAAGISLESISLYRLKFAEDKMNESEIKNLKEENVNPAERRYIKYYSKKADKASDITRNTSCALAGISVLSPAISSEWNNFFTLGVMYLEVFLVQHGSTGTVKSLAGRTRPFMYNEEASYDTKKDAAESGDANRSFYSDHTSTAFSSSVFFAKVFSDLYPDSEMIPYIWGGGILLASATACLRVAAGKHFPSDVIAGAVIGGIIGYAVPCLHYNKNKMVSVFPLINNMIGLGLAINI